MKKKTIKKSQVNLVDVPFWKEFAVDDFYDRIKENQKFNDYLP